MMSGVYHFQIHCDSNVRRLDVDNINEDISVKDLKEKVAQTGNCSASDIELIYRGCSLNDNATLKSLGLQSGVTLFVLNKIIEAPKNTTPPDIDFEQLNVAFNNAISLPNYRSAFKRLSRPSVLENIMVTTPGLRYDPVAIAIIQDPELVVHMCDPSTVRRVIDRHPALAEAAMCILSVVHEQAASTTTQQQSLFVPMEALSEEDDLESSQGSDSQQQYIERFNPTITSNQLAAALAAAQSQTTSSDNPPAGSSGTIITPEMLGQALGQAFATPPSTAGAGPPASSTPATNPDLSEMESTSRRLAQHLQQMHEMGLRDDVLNLQALEATEWNVQEAINLVFSGAMNDMDS